MAISVTVTPSRRTRTAPAAAAVAVPSHDFSEALQLRCTQSVALAARLPPAGRGATGSARLPRSKLQNHDVQLITLCLLDSVTPLALQKHLDCTWVTPQSLKLLDSESPSLGILAFLEFSKL